MLGDSINLGNLTSRNESGQLQYREQVQAFEYFAKTDLGKQWIADRAESGFQYKGQIDKSLDINISQEGRLSKMGIDYSFTYDKNIDNETKALINNDRYKIQVNLFPFTEPNYYEGVWEQLGTFSHEVLYHGHNFERAILGNNFMHSYEPKYDARVVSPIHPINHQHTGSNQESIKNSIYGQQSFQLLQQAAKHWDLQKSENAIFQRLGKGFHNYYQKDAFNGFKTFFRTK